EIVPSSTPVKPHLLIAIVATAGLVSLISIAGTGYLSRPSKQPTPIAAPEPAVAVPTEQAPAQAPVPNTSPTAHASSQPVGSADTSSGNSEQKPAAVQTQNSSGKGKSSRRWRRYRGASPSIWRSGDRTGSRYRSRK